MLIAAVLSCLFRYVPALSAVPSGFVIIICAVIAAGVMAVVAPVKTDSKEVTADA